MSLSSSSTAVSFDELAAEVGDALCEALVGRVAGVSGLTVSASGLPAPVGARCLIHTRLHGSPPAEVVGMSGGMTHLSVLGDAIGITPGDAVECIGGPLRVAVGEDLLGRVIDANGAPLDGRRRPACIRRYPLHADPPPPLERRLIDEPLPLGVRTIDALLTAGRGQRLGVFAGTGVGKSVLMGMLCRHTQAQVRVVALVGERGREVRDFIEREMSPEAMRQTVMVVSTSDQAPALRVRACFQATAIAEYFRDRGADVLLVMDSLTRMAMAQRQIGLAAGEPPTTRGYPPSVFAMLPRLLERAGRTGRGSITGLYTVLVEGDDVDEPLADAVRGILDGHIWLSRRIANRGHYPAIDVLGSISRVARDVTTPDQQAAAGMVRSVLATWEEISDLVNIGAYVRGANPDYDLAVDTRAAIEAFLRQDRDVGFGFEETRQALAALRELLIQTRAALDPGGQRQPPAARGREARS